MAHKLLLADDSVTIQRVIELTFADEDVQLTAVGDGKRAIERIEADPPDIVLADVGMPEKDGYEVAAFIKQNPRYAHIPVLLLTGAFEPVDEERAREVGCDGVLAKPFEPQMVITRVKELLDEASRSAAGRGAAARPVTDDPGLGAAPDTLDANFDAPVRIQRRQPLAMPELRVPAPEPELLADVTQDLSEAPTAFTSIPEGLEDYFRRYEPPAADLAPSDATVTVPADFSWTPPVLSASDLAPSPMDFGALPGQDQTVSIVDLDTAINAPTRTPVENPALDPAPAWFDTPVSFDIEARNPVGAPAMAALDIPGEAVPDMPAPAAAPNLEPFTDDSPIFANAFSALLAAESGPAPAAPAFVPPAAPPAGAASAVDTDELVRHITAQVLEQMTDRVVRDTVTDVVSRVAERLIREEIDRIKASIK